MLNAQVQAFQDLEPLLAGVAGALVGLVDAWSNLPDPVRQAATIFGVLAVAIAAVTAAIAGLAFAIGGIKAGLAAAKALASGFALKLGGLKVALLAATKATTLLGAALVALPWVALAAGVTALGVAIYKGVEAQRQWNDLVRDGAGFYRGVAVRH